MNTYPIYIKYLSNKYQISIKYLISTYLGAPVPAPKKGDKEGSGSSSDSSSSDSSSDSDSDSESDGEGEKGAKGQTAGHREANTAGAPAPAGGLAIAVRKDLMPGSSLPIPGAPPAPLPGVTAPPHTSPPSEPAGSDNNSNTHSYLIRRSTDFLENVFGCTLTFSNINLVFQLSSLFSGTFLNTSFEDTVDD